MASINRRKQVGRASAAITAVAAGTVVSGGTLATQNIGNGKTLYATIAMGVKTSSLTMTPSFQHSDDNSTWVDCAPLNNAANVATAAGTGSLVTTTKTIPLVDARTFKFVRAIITTAGATAHATDDVMSCTYWFEAD